MLKLSASLAKPTRHCPSAARHGKGGIQSTKEPGIKHCLDVADHKARHLDSAVGDGLTHRARYRAADQVLNSGRDQFLCPGYGQELNQSPLFPAIAINNEHPASGIKNRGNPALPIMNRDATHGLSLVQKHKHGPCRKPHVTGKSNVLKSKIIITKRHH
jgi:hypothetical protein